MGRATEELAEHLGEGIGGLLNATFGNAAELIIALTALRAGLHDVVKTSIVGSINRAIGARRRLGTSWRRCRIRTGVRFRGSEGDAPCSAASLV